MNTQTAVTFTRQTMSVRYIGVENRTPKGPPKRYLSAFSDRQRMFFGEMLAFAYDGVRNKIFQISKNTRLQKNVLSSLSGNSTKTLISDEFSTRRVDLKQKYSRRKFSNIYNLYSSFAQTILLFSLSNRALRLGAFNSILVPFRFRLFRKHFAGSF